MAVYPLWFLIDSEVTVEYTQKSHFVTVKDAKIAVVHFGAHGSGVFVPVLLPLGVRTLRVLPRASLAPRMGPMSQNNP